MKRNCPWMFLAAVAALMASSLPLSRGYTTACARNGAILRQPDGTFGIRQSQYRNNMRCSWKIQVEINNIVQLHFRSFDLEESSDCRYDGIKIFDGSDTSAPLLYNFCGSILPNNVTSSGNTMFVLFRTDRSTTRTGFNIYYSSIVPDGCNGPPRVLTEDMGTFGIGDDKRNRYMSCRWKIHVEPSKLVQLHFLNFDLGASSNCSSASVKVYDGSDTSASLLHTFCGRSLPRALTSSGNTVLVYFKIENIITYEGFKIYYSGLIPVEGCLDSPAEMGGGTGTFGIGNDQNLTYISMRCRWKISVEPYKVVQLHFLNFDLGVTSNCSSASVKVYDGSDTWGPLLHTFCGRSLPGDVTSSRNTVLVHLKIDNVTVYEGFKIYYTGWIPVEGCLGSPAEMRGNKGRLGVGEDQNLTYVSMTCRWKFRVEPSKVVQLHFLNFDLGDSSNCSSASVNVYDGSDTSASLLHTFCGRNLPGDITSSGNTLFVSFKIKNVMTYDGFKIYYSGLIPVEGCLGAIAEMRGENGTVGIGDEQNIRYITCRWRIRVSPSELVQLHYLNFDLGATSNCSSANVKVYDGIDTSAPLLHTLCGRSLPGDVTSSGNTVFVDFKIDNVATYKGFKMYYSRILPVEGCVGSPIEMTGSKRMFGIKYNQYYSDMICSWKIQVELSKRVKLHFLSFDLDVSADCSFGKVGIFDGNDTSAPLLHTLCGNSIPDDVRSSGNTMFVYFIASSNKRRISFTIYYSAFIPVEGCSSTPVEMQGSNGTFGISSNQYYSNLRCSWKIHVDLSKRVRLHFLFIDIEQCTNCVCDSLDIAAVDKTTTPVSYSFCGSTVPDDINTGTNTVSVYFRSDRSTNRSGFRIYYSAILPGQGCLGSPVTKQGPKGTFGIDKTHYDNYMTCGWKIQVEAMKRVKLHFVSFDLEVSADCSFDNVRLYDGSDMSAPLLRTFCGRSLPGDVRSSGHTMFVQFTTDVSGIYGGFSVYYSAFTTVDGCFGTPVELRGSNGTFGISDGEYHNNMRCSWKIQVSPSKRVRLHFLNFHLQKTTGCRYDSVKIFDGTDTSAPLMHTFCGSTVPDDITSSANTLFVHFFSSDNTSTYSGFKIYYSDIVVPGGCHSNTITMRGPRGSFGITQVQYTNYMRCRWNIQVDSTDVVKLEFVEFSVESCCDSVKVYDGSNMTAPLLGTFYGHTLPNDVVSTNSTISVYFESDGSGRWKGFNINYTALPLTKAQCKAGSLFDEVTGRCVLYPLDIFKNKVLDSDSRPNPSHQITPTSELVTYSAGGQADCQPGEIFGGQKCVKCPRGTYQPDRGKTACIDCPMNYTTPDVGSTNVDDCKSDCQPGEMIDGQKCAKCPRGTYQPDRGKNACIDCPLNYTTRDVGSTGVDDCQWQCESGYQQDGSRELCVACSRGFYKDKLVHFDCQPCPSHLTTPGPGATSVSDCSQGNCAIGQRIVGTTCKRCSVGTYQDKMWQTTCIPCGGNLTTLREGASSVTECTPECDTRYCLNCGLSQMNNSANPVCLCTGEYESERCNYTLSGQVDVRHTGLVVGATVAVVVLLLLVMAGIAIGYRRKHNSCSDVPTRQEVGEYNVACEAQDTGV